MDLRTTARRLRDLVEPIAAAVYFAPEAHRRYQELGVGDFGSGYFGSRGACLGRVPWTVVSASFGVFKPAVVEAAVNHAWSQAAPESLLHARLAGAEEQFARLLGEPTDDVERATVILRELTEGVDGAGRMLYSGLRALPWPGSPWGSLWRAADLVREHRGDGHIAAWIPHVDAVEINILGELWWRVPLVSYSRTRGWSEEELRAAVARLEARNLVSGDAFTAEGEALRADIEHETDQAEREVVARLGDRADELFALLAPMSKAIVAGGGYPRDPSELTRM